MSLESATAITGFPRVAGDRTKVLNLARTVVAGGGKHPLIVYDESEMYSGSTDGSYYNSAYLNSSATCTYCGSNLIQDNIAPSGAGVGQHHFSPAVYFASPVNSGGDAEVITLGYTMEAPAVTGYIPLVAQPSRPVENERALPEFHTISENLSKLHFAASQIIPGLREMNAAEQANLRSYYKKKLRKL